MAPLATRRSRRFQRNTFSRAHAIESTRRPTEHAADTLARLGAARIAKVLADANHG
jgi:hypothetical protein